METQVCKGECGLEKPLSEFPYIKDRNCYRTTCKSCISELNKMWNRIRNGSSRNLNKHKLVRKCLNCLKPFNPTGQNKYIRICDPCKRLEKFRE